MVMRSRRRQGGHIMYKNMNTKIMQGRRRSTKIMIMMMRRGGDGGR